MTLRFGEVLHDGFAQLFDIKHVLADERSEFQTIRIYDTVRNGRMLVLDDIVQLTTRDEFTYSEMLAHVPILDLMAQGHIAQRVLIVGGGDGAIAEEVLKHRTMGHVVMAEIDRRVVELCKEHFGEVNKGAFADERLSVRYEDAFAYLKSSDAKGQFDVIIADRPDPVGPAEVLFADDFYTVVAEALTPQGVAVFQTGTPFYQPSELAGTMPQLHHAFEKAGVYYTITPTYTGGPMALTWASNGTVLGETEDATLARLYDAIGLRTDYYSPEIHKAAFALPPWMRRVVNGARLLPGERPQIVAAS